MKSKYKQDKTKRNLITNKKMYKYLHLDSIFSFYHGIQIKWLETLKVFSKLKFYYDYGNEEFDKFIFIIKKINKKVSHFSSFFGDMFNEQKKCS